MNRTRSNPDADLEASLRRIAGALQANRNQYAAVVEQITAATTAEVAERISEKIAARRQRHLERHEREMERLRKRHERRKTTSYYDPAELPKAFVSSAAAIVCVVLAFFQPWLWWLIFVAFGFASSAATSFGKASRHRRAGEQEQPEKPQEAVDSDRRAEPVAEEAKPAVPQEPPDPRVIRIQTLCDKLLAELESGPPIVREVVTQPQATIGGLRQACLEIARRERELRGALAAQEESAIVAERDALTTRLSHERDEIVRDRLGQALRALEQQLAHRAELATAATRLEAENTRILYTLENLNMQLLRARATDVGAPELGGKLRDSLHELGTEIDAVAEALEWASTPGGNKPSAPLAAPPATSLPPAASEAAEMAEKQDAARRAAQARDAQRH